ncbi:hypothetical protein [Rhizobium sp. TRM95796]|uniref:hypothetical protein n=1 Tax=Rhizobium sp. TRM95796 TaxID=2979862 RepID=UPI0021E9A455|nr:hypothetical protein [Rhizobium sp. TRM95796]MCV3767587.1 hypothetical protein [Rhizobium sp. TRM95796]
MQPKDKFIAFIDILGFSQLIAKLEENGEGFSEALELTEALGPNICSVSLAGFGPTTCPSSTRIEENLDFQATQISDCVVISVEISPAGIINLLSHCYGISLKLLAKGALCRGSIIRGKIYHTNAQFFGTGYMSAYKGESQVRFLQSSDAEKGTPFIALSDQITDYIKNDTDESVRMMAQRMTRSDGTYTAIYPFTQMGRNQVH